MAKFDTEKLKIAQGQSETYIGDPSDGSADHGARVYYDDIDVSGVDQIKTGGSYDNNLHVTSETGGFTCKTGEDSEKDFVCTSDPDAGKKGMITEENKLRGEQ